MLYLGVSSYLMPPVAFLQKPSRWLKAVSIYGATTSGGPNFAYDLCVQKITPEQCEQLDLSCWRTAVHTAELIRAQTQARFSDTFKAYGFRREAFYPCYGLAEGTLFVTGSDCLRVPVLAHVDKTALQVDQVEAVPVSAAQTFVSCGYARLGTEVAIVDPASLKRCVANTVGEIWVSGPSVAQGYWQQAEATTETFQAYLADTGEGPFLRTGDLGFMRDGELFVTGRRKELLILRGRNHYPQDLELSASQSHPALASVSGAAFTVEVSEAGIEEERLVVVHEVQRTHIRSLDAEEVGRCIRGAMAREHELFIHAIVLVKPASIPKTSSGKIQRYVCREDYLQGRLKALHVLGQETGLEPEAANGKVPATVDEMCHWLQAWLEGKLHQPVEGVDPAQSLSDYGLDSLIVIELHNAIEATFGIDMPIEAFFEDLSLSDLVRRCVQSVSGNGETSVPIETASPWETYRQLQHDTTTSLEAGAVTFAQPHDPAWKQRLVGTVERFVGVRRIETLFQQTLATQVKKRLCGKPGSRNCRSPSIMTLVRLNSCRVTVAWCLSQTMPMALSMPWRCVMWWSRRAVRFGHWLAPSWRLQKRSMTISCRCRLPIRRRRGRSRARPFSACWKPLTAVAPWSSFQPA